MDLIDLKLKGWEVMYYLNTTDILLAMGRSNRLIFNYEVNDIILSYEVNLKGNIVPSSILVNKTDKVIEYIFMREYSKLLNTKGNN